jgi:hypothetical protein
MLDTPCITELLCVNRRGACSVLLMVTGIYFLLFVPLWKAPNYPVTIPGYGQESSGNMDKKWTRNEYKTEDGRR